MSVDAAVREHRYVNAEEAAAAVPGAQVRFVPLQRPTSHWHMVEMGLGDSRMLCGRMGAETSIFGALDRKLLYFLTPLSGFGWKSFGKEIGHRSLAVLSGASDHAAWIGGSVHSMAIQVPAEKFAKAYSRFSADAMPSWPTMRTFALAGPTAARLRSSIATTLQLALRFPDTFARPGMGKVLEDLLLDRVMRALGASSRGERPEYRALASRCSDYLEANANRPVTLCELRDTLGIGDRALRRFFVSAYGTSPARFLRIQRLHGVNRALSEPRPDCTVTAVAMSFGFFDLGRFARDFRQIFGEHPSETLQNARGSDCSK